MQRVRERGLIADAPSFVASGLQYEVMMGSVAFGVSTDESDVDIYGFCIPPRDHVFPHLRGEVADFDAPAPRFQQYQRHHIRDAQALSGQGRDCDFTIFSIVKFFRQCLDCNPNLIDCLYAPRRCVLFTTGIGELVRERRKIFLHRGAWHRFKGYAYSQMHKLRIKQPEGKRKEMVERYGFDVKFGYHIVRLLDEVEQILVKEDIDLERNREQLKSIRRGEWTLERLERYFEEKERQLEGVYSRSRLPAEPDHRAVKTLLLQCLEEHYGSLDASIARPDEVRSALREIRGIVERVADQL
ncbi:MAG: nucleotidyltransferase domain-containing protein [Thermoanaerobaculia bacterium]|nr:nucleotidyltransferase domain-containing protein [Thermoanaerobaculia bacterium]